MSPSVFNKVVIRATPLCYTVRIWRNKPIFLENRFLTEVLETDFFSIDMPTLRAYIFLFSELMLVIR